MNLREGSPRAAGGGIGEGGATMDLVWQQCIRSACGRTFDLGEVLPGCPACGDLLDVRYAWERLPLPATRVQLGRAGIPSGGPAALSGVWRFAPLLPFAPPEARISIGEGHTQLRPAPRVADFAGLSGGGLHLQYEGLNPSGSFKDNGMAGAFAHARLTGATRAACASTGNTSASLAAFSAASRTMRAIIFIGEGRIAYGKLSQALDFGAMTLMIAGDFDDAMARVREVCREEGIYLVNSVNPFRLEGQKTIMYRVLEGLGWEVPDWIVVPGGNLGNSSAFGKAFRELYDLGYIDRMPRLAVINAAGAATLDTLVNERGLRWRDGEMDDAVVRQYYEELDTSERRAETLASAIEINRPVNLTKCLRALEWTDGVVRSVSDQEILDAKAWVAREGLGCEPASAASVAGLRRLVAEGVVEADARVVCVLTGHPLKDPHVTVAYHSESEAALRERYGSYGVTRAQHRNAPLPVANDTAAILDVIRAADRD